MTTENGRTWNRRFRAWQWYFVALFITFLAVLFVDKPVEYFAEWAKWSTISLVALIGGLSLTDAVFNRRT